MAKLQQYCWWRSFKRKELFIKTHKELLGSVVEEKYFFL